MSIVISTGEQISKHQTNRSKSKMLYSFSKTPRFLSSKNLQKQLFYEIDSSSKNLKKLNRSTCLGYGKKYDFTKDVPVSPPPGTYEQKGCFEENVRKRKGFQFGISRENVKSQSFFNLNKSPGPGEYEPRKQKNLIAYSLSGEHGKIINTESIKNPGPGSYDLKRNFEKGCSDVFTKRSCHNGNSFSHSKKLKNENQKIPGPGSYHPNFKTVSQKQNRLKTEITRPKSVVFGRSNRITVMINPLNIPGPGEYQAPSQFGHYLSKKAL